MYDSFASVKALEANWNKKATWLPSDSTSIQTHGSSKNPPAILVAKTRTALDPAKCVKTTRLSGPDYAASWEPNAYVKSAWVCGDWDVIPTGSGWFGWTPNSPKERAAIAVGRPAPTP
jgi:hypothetical protein